MSYREVEDEVDFGDDELNTARQVIPKVQTTHQEDSSMKDRSLAEYRVQKNYESDSQDGGSQKGCYPGYDAEPEVTGNESPSSNASNVGDAFYEEFVDYEAYAQAQDASAGHLPSDEGGSNNNDMDDPEEGSDSESDSQDGSIRHPPSDVSGSDENMLGASEHRGNPEDAEDAHDSDSQNTSVRYPPSDSDEDMLTSSQRFDGHENADLDNELYELARPPSPMSTDAEVEDIEMNETASGQVATSFHSEMSEVETYPVMSDDLSETAAQRVQLLTLKSRISPFDRIPSSPPQTAYKARANPKFVIDFGVDTNDLAPLKPDTDMSEAPLQPAPPKTQNTMEYQSELEPALRSPKEACGITNPASQANQDVQIDVPADTKTATLAVQVPSFSPTFNFDFKKSPTITFPALQSFNPRAWNTPFNFSPEEPVGEPQRSVPTDEAGSSEKERCVEEQNSPEPKLSHPSSYKDAGAQISRATSSAQTQTPQEWVATDTSREAERKRKLLAAMEGFAEREAAWQDKSDAFTAKFEAYFEQLKAERAERVARHAKSRAERAKRHAEMDARHAEWKRTQAERDERLLKAQEELVHCVVRGHARMVAHLARCEAFYAKIDGYQPPDFLDERIKELLARPLGRSEDVQKIVDEAEAAVAEWNARYEAHVAKVQALGEKIKAVKL